MIAADDEHGLHCKVAPVSDEDFEPFVGGPPPDPSERTWRHPSEIAAQAHADAMAEIALSARGRRSISSWLPSSPSTVVIAGSLGAAACLTAFALFQLGTGDNAPEPPDIAGPATTVEARTIDLVDAAAATGVDPSITVQPTSTVGVSLSPTVSPAVATAAEDQLVQITIGTDHVASGVLAHGYLITSASAVGNRLSVSYSHRDRWALAYLVGIDPFSDLAVFRSSAESRAGRTLQALSTNVDEGTTGWTDSQADFEAAPGDRIAAVTQAADGLQSATGTIIATDHNGMTSSGQPLIGLIDTSIRQPEHLGGALIDADGNVVGIIVDTSSSLASAIPIGDATAIADRLSQQGWANETWIGFLGMDRNDGVEVVDVSSGGPADTADLRPGDVVRYLDGARIDHMGGITAGLRRAEPGDMVVVVVERGGELVAVRIQVTTYESGRLGDELVEAVPNGGGDPPSASEPTSLSEQDGG